MQISEQEREGTRALLPASRCATAIRPCPASPYPSVRPRRHAGCSGFKREPCRVSRLQNAALGSPSSHRPLQAPERHRGGQCLHHRNPEEEELEGEFQDRRVGLLLQGTWGLERAGGQAGPQQLSLSDVFWIPRVVAACSVRAPLLLQHLCWPLALCTFPAGHPPRPGGQVWR